MSSEPTSDVLSVENVSTKPKRLPRSAKKRLRYERLRQHHREFRKKKKPKNNDDPSVRLPQSSDTHDEVDKQDHSKISKVYKRFVNERLAEVNRSSEAPVICIDCAYNESMSPKEIASLARQIGRCYSINRRSPKPVQLVLTNWSKESLLAKECRRVNSGFDNYQIILNEKSIDESHPLERLVYLSPNADKPLTDMDEQNIYVIGGLVDESVRRNVTYETCQHKKINCFRLPIEVYMEHSSTRGTFNKILAINQVFDILITYMTGKDWGEALKKNIPERKGWIVKNCSEENKTETV